ncbi:mechanosensitive ion channel protein MscS, partial [Thiococcus pfennigii]|nr:mechanosensitive ion channel protein MscS [Thiococcus pfennigii]
MERRLAELAEAVDAPKDDAVPDPRLAPLADLRLALQREAALAGRVAEIDAALAEQQAQRATFEDTELGEPPYSITLLDRLQAERRLNEQAAAGADQAMDAAARRVAAAEKDLAAAERARRQA